jgi:SAM-dependent methyltransferase
VTGIEYLKMDLINVPKLGQYYDVIECVGVLHHLKEPKKGWRVLVECLRPGGFMKVGVYSATARLPITYARKLFSVSGSDLTADMIRQCRQRVINAQDTYWSRFILACDDFYSLSGARDLLFHVQEHVFSLSMIEKSLAELGLEFRGFDLPTPVLKKYVEEYPDDPKMRNLANWEAFEKENPSTFLGMYTFWCLKAS